MGEAKRKLDAVGGTKAPQPPRARIHAYLSQTAYDLVVEGFDRLVAAQNERKLVAATWDIYIEHLLGYGLDKMAQALAGAQIAPPTERRILTPAEAASEAYRGRRTR